MRDLTIGKSDYDWRAVLGVVFVVVAYLLSRVDELPAAWASWIRIADVALGGIGVALAATGRPIIRAPK